MNRWLWAALSSLALAGCSVTVPVTGLMGDGSEVYKGTATGYMGGTGDIKMKGVASGTECFGGFTYTRVTGGTGSRGIADVMCKDGRKARVDFLAESRNKGMGTGKDSEGQPFVFTYGMTDAETVALFKSVMASKRQQQKAPSSARTDSSGEPQI